MTSTNRTPRSRIKGQLRQMWIRSNERITAMKRDNYSCCKCGIKQSKKKGAEVSIQVHHKEGILVWDDIIELITQHLLCPPDKLQTLCTDCHDNTPPTLCTDCHDNTPPTPPNTPPSTQNTQ